MDQNQAASQEVGTTNPGGSLDRPWEPHAFAPLDFGRIGGRPAVTDWCGYPYGPEGVCGAGADHPVHGAGS